MALRTQPRLKIQPHTNRRHQSHVSWHVSRQQRQIPPASTSPGSAPQPKSSSAKVFEVIKLMNCNEAAEASEALLDTMWSLQYRVAGVLCTFAGKLVTSDPGPFPPARPINILAQYTHAIHYRFATQQAALGFISHPLMLAAHQDFVTQLCRAHVNIIFEGAVTNEVRMHGPVMLLSL